MAQGNFTSPGDPGWIFFKFIDADPDGIGCGIGPDGTVGCDTVPINTPEPGDCGDDRCPVIPPGANQTIAGPQQPVEYVQSDTLTFTRDVDDLPEGHRLVNGDAWCAVGFQGSVSCTSGVKKFTLAPGRPVPPR